MTFEEEVQFAQKRAELKKMKSKKVTNYLLLAGVTVVTIAASTIIGIENNRILSIILKK